MFVNVHAHLYAHDDLDLIIEHHRHPDVRWTCFCGIAESDNPAVKKAMEQYPDFVVGLGVVELGKKTADPDAVSHLHEQGFKGLKLIYPFERYDSEKYFPVYERAQSLDMPILFHTGFVALEPPGDRPGATMTKMRPDCFDAIARGFPNLKIIGAHLGVPYYWEAVSMATYHENVYFDLTGGCVRALPLPTLRSIFSFADLYSTPGRTGIDMPSEELRVNTELFRKILFGTDGPSPQYLLDFYIYLMDAFRVEDAIRKGVLGETAARLFGLKA
ncbi:MAG: amidohydrolase family protein [Candidatus Lindowbacteria bacterium]|nr:amidohydrolase family protein [Candidatus Lindowbacteria bacterium]